MNLPTLCSSQAITTREQFHTALAHVNAQAKREDLTVEAAKATMTKAEALRAWASFDKRLTVDEKREANRAMTRTAHMIAELAGRETPNWATGRKGMKRGTPGPVLWIVKNMGWTNGMAVAVRRLALHPEKYRTILESGAHWSTGLQDRQGPSILNRTATWVKNMNSLRLALTLRSCEIPKALTQIRKIKAWCEAYEAALIQRQAKEKRA